MDLTILIFTLILQVLLVKGTDIEGTIAAPIGASPNWAAETKVRVDGNRYLGFIKPDGSFIISDVAPGSYLVEFTNPTFLFQVNNKLFEMFSLPTFVVLLFFSRLGYLVESVTH